MAVQTSLLQMVLCQSITFLTRVAYNMAQYAVTVKAEPLATVGHAARSTYANYVIANPNLAAQNACTVIAGSTNIIGTIVIGATPGLTDSSATDAALYAQIATLWDALAGVDTGS